MSAPYTMSSSSQENNCTAAQLASFKHVHWFWTGNKSINLTPVQEWSGYIIFMCCWWSYSRLFLSHELAQTTAKSSHYSASRQISSNRIWSMNTQIDIIRNLQLCTDIQHPTGEQGKKTGIDLSTGYRERPKNILQFKHNREKKMSNRTVYKYVYW